VQAEQSESNLQWMLLKSRRTTSQQEGASHALKPSTAWARTNIISWDYDIVFLDVGKMDRNSKLLQSTVRTNAKNSIWLST